MPECRLTGLLLCLETSYLRLERCKYRGTPFERFKDRLPLPDEPTHQQRLPIPNRVDLGEPGKSVLPRVRRFPHQHPVLATDPLGQLNPVKHLGQRPRTKDHLLGRAKPTVYVQLPNPRRYTRPCLQVQRFARLELRAGLDRTGPQLPQFQSRTI